VLASLRRWVDVYAAEGAPAIAQAWKARPSMLGTEVTADGVTGIARDVDADGALWLDTPAGPRRVLSGGLS
jgi:biotin-(acetyl-CoA carboxylase) ligase